MVEKVEQTVQKAESKIRHIVRVANVDIPGNKHLRISLTKMKGVGRNFAHVLCNLSGISGDKLAGKLTDSEVTTLTEMLQDPAKAGIPEWLFNRRKDFDTGEDKHLFIGNLQFTKENDIKRLKKIKVLRGIRHQKGLPVRGQRTKSNFRRNKGKVIGVKKKK
jgi:small subunit ribosomal protein S13